MRGLLIFLLALVGSLAEAQTCAYDSKTQEFQFEPGKKIGLIFGVHGTPGYISEYVGSGNAHLASEVRKLLGKHSDTLKEMNATFDRTLSVLSKKKVEWIGFENSQEGIDSLGGFKGLMEFLRNEDLRMQKLGLNEKERRDYLIIMTDPIVAAQYWLRFKKPGQKLGDTSTAPATAGFDNHRDNGLDELKKKLMAIFVKYDDLREELNQKDLAMPSWVIDELNTFKIGATFSQEPSKAADFLRKVLADPRAGTLNLAQKRKIEGLRDFIASNADFVRTTVLREDAEFAKRDQGIAQDISQLSTLHGYGLAHIGGRHKEGVIAHLTHLCRNPAVRRNVPAARPGPVTR